MASTAEMYSLVLFVCSFVLLHHAACGILVPRPGIEPGSSAMEARSLNLWTARDAPEMYSHCLEAGSPKSRCRQGCGFSGGSQGECCPPLPAPGRSLARGRTTPVSASVSTWPSSLPLLLRMPVISVTTLMTSSQPDHICKDPISK